MFCNFDWICKEITAPSDIMLVDNAALGKRLGDESLCNRLITTMDTTAML
jgi:hypothetical protein